MTERETSAGAASALPLFAVSEVVTPLLTFAEDLALYRAAGVQGIGIVGRKLGRPDDLSQFRESGLAATICMPSHPDDAERFEPGGAASVTASSVTSILPYAQQRGSTPFETRLQEICAAVCRLAPFRPVCVRLDTGPRGALDETTARNLVTAGLKEVARAAAKVDLTIGVEPVHASLRDLYGWVNTLAAGVELCDEVGETNVGVIFDTWHLWDTRDVLRDIRRYADRVVAVHVGDWRVPTRSPLDRVLPGDGVGDLPAIFAALEEGGYRGWYELEVVSDETLEGSLWKWEPATLVHVGRDRFHDLWARRSE